MDIYFIWASTPGSTDELWLVDTWDEHSMSDNREGWENSLAEARADHGIDNVRVVKTSIDVAEVQRAFEVITIEPGDISPAQGL